MIRISKYLFSKIEFSELIDVYYRPIFFRKIKSQKWLEYIYYQEELLKKLLELGFEIDGKFNFLIVSKGRMFKKITKVPYKGGICGKRDKNEDYLVFDKTILGREINKDKEKYLLHELVHLICYKYAKEIPTAISEGLAELIPIYILGYYEHHVLLSEKEFVSINTIDKKGALDEDLKTPAQDKNTYKSSYLLVLKIVKEIQKKYKLAKTEALLMLLGILKDTKNEKNVYKNIAKLINVDARKLKSKKFILKASLKKIK